MIDGAIPANGYFGAVIGRGGRGFVLRRPGLCEPVLAAGRALKTKRPVAAGAANNLDLAAGGCALARWAGTCLGEGLPRMDRIESAENAELFLRGKLDWR